MAGDLLAGFVEAWIRWDNQRLSRPPKRGATAVPTRRAAVAVEQAAAALVGPDRVPRFRDLCVQARGDGWLHHRAAAEALHLLTEETS